MHLNDKQVFDWAGQNEARWKLLKGALLEHMVYGECQITEIAGGKVYYGDLTKLSFISSISGLVSFKKIPNNLSERIVQDNQVAEQKRKENEKQARVWL